MFKYGIRVGSISPGPVISALLAEWLPERLKEARELGGLLDANEVANVVMFMLTRPRGMTIRDVVMMPTTILSALLDPKGCATLLSRVVEKAGQLDILHANAGVYVGGDLVDADTGAIDRMLHA